MQAEEMQRESLIFMSTEYRTGIYIMLLRTNRHKRNCHADEFFCVSTTALSINIDNVLNKHGISKRLNNFL